jgi:hypothetical protein
VRVAGATVVSNSERHQSVSESLLEAATSGCQAWTCVTRMAACPGESRWRWTLFLSLAVFNLVCRRSTRHRSRLVDDKVLIEQEMCRCYGASTERWCCCRQVVLLQAAVFQRLVHSLSWQMRLTSAGDGGVGQHPTLSSQDNSHCECRADSGLPGRLPGRSFLRARGV